MVIPTPTPDAPQTWIAGDSSNVTELLRPWRGKRIRIEYVGGGMSPIIGTYCGVDEGYLVVRRIEDHGISSDGPSLWYGRNARVTLDQPE